MFVSPRDSPALPPPGLRRRGRRDPAAVQGELPRMPLGRGQLSEAASAEQLQWFLPAQAPAGLSSAHRPRPLRPLLASLAEHHGRLEEPGAASTGPREAGQPSGASTTPAGGSSPSFGPVKCSHAGGPAAAFPARRAQARTPPRTVAVSRGDVPSRAAGRSRAPGTSGVAACVTSVPTSPRCKVLHARNRDCPSPETQEKESRWEAPQPVSAELTQSSQEATHPWAVLGPSAVPPARLGELLAVTQGRGLQPACYTHCRPEDSGVPVESKDAALSVLRMEYATQRG
ncbi:uncharacterized protein LOC142004272 isoform X3 [Carettochelys insculpta]|uniref:uncharacterized protein LOC142004272 isoform X3 n=1 Tax=Carettochelys insculpta TaxID=44489 RepID=UPI003EB6BCDB